MAAFTTLAIAALAGGAGGLFAGKKLGAKQQAAKDAAATPAAPALAPPPSPPPSTSQANSNAQVTALAAAAKQRKKASAGPYVNTARSSVAAPTPSLAQTTLLGY